MSTARNSKNKSLLYLLTCLLIINLLLLSGINLQSYLNKDRVLGAEAKADDSTVELQKERDFWKTFLSENPNYIEGWIELSKVDSGLGNFADSENDLKIARAIDPNSEKLDR